MLEPVCSSGRIGRPLFAGVQLLHMMKRLACNLLQCAQSYCSPGISASNCEGKPQNLWHISDSGRQEEANMLTLQATMHTHRAVLRIYATPGLSSSAGRRDTPTPIHAYIAPVSVQPDRRAAEGYQCCPDIAGEVDFRPRSPEERPDQTPRSQRR